jgi:hypothetical protein
MADAGDPTQEHDGTGSKYGPRLTFAEREALARQAVTDRANALEDPGTGQAFILLGWIPPLIIAAIGSVIVGLRTGSLGALAAVLIGGTVAGYIASLVILFTVGHSLEQRRAGSLMAKALIGLVVVVGIAAASTVVIVVDRG